jgi:hypothetical protein
MNLQRDLADAELGRACLLRRPLTTSGSTSRSRGVQSDSRRRRSASSACSLPRLAILRERRLDRAHQVRFLERLGQESTAPLFIARTEDGTSHAR